MTSDPVAPATGGPGVQMAEGPGGQAEGPLGDAELRGIDAYWRAANYLSVGQIYLLANPLLTEPLRPEHIKPRLLGHWGTTPGLNFVYVHMNRAIRLRDLDAMYVIGPGHGGPGLVANAWRRGRAAGCSGSSPFPAGCRATSPRRRPAPSTRAVSWATRSRTPTAPRSTTPTWWSAAWSATARPRPARWPPAGTAPGS